MAGSEEPMTPADTALALLRESRDGGRIFTDNGATVTRLAREAGVTVTFLHVNLTTLTTELRTVEGEGGEHGRDNAF